MNANQKKLTYDLALCCAVVDVLKDQDIVIAEGNTNISKTNIRDRILEDLKSQLLNYKSMDASNLDDVLKLINEL